MTKNSQVLSVRYVRRVRDRLNVVLLVGVLGMYVSLRRHPLSHDDIAEVLCVYEPETSAWARREAAQRLPAIINVKHDSAPFPGRN